QLADRFVKNPAEVVKVGDRLKVHVLEVDLQRRRIGLSARTQPAAGVAKPPSDRNAAAAHNASKPQPSAGNKDSGKGLRHNPFGDRFRR
ncbi:MAG: hypothetical protein RL701_354, partial [Pseudomonadota bacterium]